MRIPNIYVYKNLILSFLHACDKRKFIKKKTKLNEQSSLNQRKRKDLEKYLINEIKTNCVIFLNRSFKYILINIFWIYSILTDPLNIFCNCWFSIKEIVFFKLALMTSKIFYFMSWHHIYFLHLWKKYLLFV